MNRKERRAAQRLGRGPDATDQAQRLFAQAIQHHQVGQLAEAERLYRSLLAIRPQHEHSLHNLGLLALQTGRNDVAAEFFGKALAINGGNAEWRYNYAYALQQCGRAEEAVAQYRQAVALKPDYAEAHLNLGNLLLKLGRPAEATACYERIAALKPDFAETHYNLGNVLAMQGRIQEAIACFERSIAIKPLAEAHNNLGIALARDPARAQEALLHYQRALALNPQFTQARNNIGNLHAARGEMQKAADIYGEIIKADPNNADAYENLARALVTVGEAVAAVSVIAQALKLRESPSAKALFATSVKQMRSGSDHPALRELAARALAEAWGRPADLADFAASLVKANAEIGGRVARAEAAWPRRPGWEELFGAGGLAQLDGDALLQAMLTSGRVSDMALERFLTAARHALLQRAQEPDQPGADGHGAAFWQALAQQCFVNEYVYATDEAEETEVARLAADIAAALETGSAIDPLRLMALAAYRPLHGLAQAERLLERAWPDSLAALLTQQIREPGEERALRAKVARLTSVEDAVSQQVQAQYEQNPYPRWVKAPLAPPPAPIEDRLRNIYPLVPFNNLGKGGAIDILIAGCGTGQHAVEVARRYPDARILAVDLSLTSLAYAARKTAELGCRNVEFAQADILSLGNLGRSFDVIESSGVLHHLADPMAGWRVLFSLLRPNGFMNIGLYSERARQDIVAARRFIAERGYQQTVADIRRCRQDLMAMPEHEPLRRITMLGDFHTVSDCRDLLFHVQEHRLSLPQIKTFLQETGLRFLGFEIESWTLHAYAREFPDDRTRTDLDNWHVFETRHPQTFISMYQFWVQRSL